MSGLRPYAGVWNYFSTKILGLRPYLHDFLTKGVALISNKTKVRIEKISGLRPYTGVWNYFSMKILGLRPYLHDFLTKGVALTSS